MQPSLFKLHLGTTRFFPLRCFCSFPAYAVHSHLTRLPFLKAFGHFTAAKSVFCTPKCTNRYLLALLAYRAFHFIKCRRLLPAPAALAFWLRLQRFYPFSACVRYSVPKHYLSHLCPLGCSPLREFFSYRFFYRFR